MLNKIYTDLTKWRKRLLQNRKRTYRPKKQKKTSRKRPRRKFKQKYLKGGDSLNNIGGSSGNKYYSKILNPATGSFVSITSKVGQTLLNNYLNVLAHHN